MDEKEICFCQFCGREFEFGELCNCEECGDLLCEQCIYDHDCPNDVY